jgi:hypothetical protein
MEKQTGFITTVLVSLIGLASAVFFFLPSSSIQRLAEPLKMGGRFIIECFAPRSVKSKVIHVTVFIHGTVGVSLSLLKPEFISAFRNHPLLEQDQILGREGLYEFDRTSADPKHASAHIIPVYDAVYGLVKNNRFANESSSEAVVKAVDREDAYLVFGWSGLLSQEARKKAGFDLYDELCACRDKIKLEHGVEPVFTIIGHSHGGNVPLWLAAAEQEKGCKLTIALLYMLGTPIQVETAPFIVSKMFKAVVLGYSHGDGIQGNDRFSTEIHKSYKRMAHLIDLDTFVAENPGYVRCDMRYVVNRESKRVTHFNMWLMGRSKKLADCVDPLPLAIFVPLFAQACYYDPLCTQYTAHLDVKNGLCCTYLTAGRVDQPRSPKIGVSENIYDLIAECQERVAREWQADDKIRSLVFNRKNIWAIRDAYKKTYTENSKLKT